MKHSFFKTVDLWMQKKSRFIVFSFFFTIFLFLYRDSLESMIKVWLISKTYSHCILIAPIALYMIWSGREKLANVPFRFEFASIFLILLSSLCWYAGFKVHVQLLQHLSLIAIFILLVLFVFGRHIFKLLIFPLCYLFFLVPFGEFLVQPMIKLTGIFSVKMLELVNIPVFYEGSYIDVPSGKWQVAEACSGVRYIMASLSLGVFFAYITFDKTRNRILFILLSILFPIIANGLRAFLIIVIGHLSEMKLAVGIDHIVYGWVFFGFVMLCLFSIGTFWKRKVEGKVERTREKNSYVIKKDSALVSLFSLLLVMICMSVGPLFAYNLEGSGVNSSYERVNDLRIQGWDETNGTRDIWKPDYHGADFNVHTAFNKEGDAVVVRLFVYSNDDSDGELVNSKNTLVLEDNEIWKILNQRKVSIEKNGKKFKLNETRITSEDNELLVWSYYVISGRYTTNKYVAKLFELISLLLNKSPHGSIMILSSKLDSDYDYEYTKSVLTDFLVDTYPLEDKLVRISINVD